MTIGSYETPHRFLDAEGVVAKCKLLHGRFLDSEGVLAALFKRPRAIEPINILLFDAIIKRGLSSERLYFGAYSTQTVSSSRANQPCKHVEPYFGPHPGQHRVGGPSSSHNIFQVMIDLF